jgi:hypothetical protein
MPLLRAACPSFEAPWQTYVADATYDARLLYVHLGEFARHLVGLMVEGRLSDFEAIFDVIERLHVEGDSYVKEAATIGLLEGIQNVAGDRTDPEAFVPYLKPETAKWWRALNAWWDGDTNAARRLDA